MRTINSKSNWRELTPIEENQPSLSLSAFFSGSVFLFAACGSEFQEQASLVEKEASPVKGKFEKWHRSKNKDFQALKSNARMKLKASIQLINRFKMEDWSSYKKFNIPISLVTYQGDGLTSLPNYPFSPSRSFPIC
jgi:hypothetical protein